MKWYYKILLLIINLLLIIGLYKIGITHIISFFLGVFIGSITILYWESKKENSFLSGIVKMVSEDIGGKNKK